MGAVLSDSVKRGERLKTFIATSFDGNKKKFRAITGLTPNELWNLCNPPQGLGSSRADTLCNVLGLPIGYFDEDHDSPYIVTPVVKAGSLPKGMYVELRGQIREKEEGYVLIEELPLAEQGSKLVAITKNPQAYCLRVIGDHLRPRYRNGQNLLVSPGEAPMPSEDVLVKLVSGETFIKEFFWTQSGAVSLCGLSLDSRPVTYRVDQIEFMHPIKGVVQLAE